MSDDKLTVHIGNLEDMGARFVSAWKATERGEVVNRDTVTFLGLDAFLSAMSPKRLELMRHLRRAGPMSVRALSLGLVRDYKSVHREVALLVETGLIERRAVDIVCINWDRAVTELDLAA